MFKIPNRLTISENLDIENSYVCKIPDDLICKGTIFAKNTVLFINKKVLEKYKKRYTFYNY